MDGWMDGGWMGGWMDLLIGANVVSTRKGHHYTTISKTFNM